MHLDKPTYIVHVHVYVGHFLTGARSQKTIKIKRLSVLTCKTQKKTPVELEIIKNNNGPGKKLKLVFFLAETRTRQCNRVGVAGREKKG